MLGLLYGTEESEIELVLRKVNKEYRLLQKLRPEARQPRWGDEKSSTHAVDSKIGRSVDEDGLCPHMKRSKQTQSKTAG